MLLLGSSIFGLSGGEKQKIACGNVAAVSDVQVFDEPSSNLDMQSVQELRYLLEILKLAGEPAKEKTRIFLRKENPEKLRHVQN